MPSPFPGMNPYLEQPDVWSDFHDTCIVMIRQRLASVLLPRYTVSIQHTVYIHEMPDDEVLRRFKPDLAIRRVPEYEKEISGGGVLTVSPARVRLVQPIEEERISYLEIRDRSNRELVTVMELLSPTNKMPGPDRQLYLGKRKSILYSNTNLVEIDLLRCGPPLPVEPPMPRVYSIIISRPATRPEADIWPFTLRDAIPEIPIPLAAGEPEPTLSLQQILHDVYDSCHLALSIYRQPPEPPLNAEDAAWAEAILGSENRTTV